MGRLTEEQKNKLKEKWESNWRIIRDGSMDKKIQKMQNEVYKIALRFYRKNDKTN